MARRSERRSEARQPKAPTLQESADRLGAANDGIGTAGGDLADVWKSIAGLGLPAEVLAEAQRDYLVDATAIWNRLLVPGAPHAISDRRFASPEWTGNPSAAFLAELYLLNARTLLKLAKARRGRRRRPRRGCASPCSSGSTRRRRATTSRSIRRRRRRRSRPTARASLHGLKQLWNDAQRGHLSQTDESAFEVGRNVATTEGSVIFENELFQLIEYAPLTAKVHERPILFVPPCINKFYILDLQPENSLIRHTVGEGHRALRHQLEATRARTSRKRPGTTTSRTRCCARSRSSRR